MGVIPDEVLRQNAIGVKLDVTIYERGVPVDLSSVSQKNYIIEKPSGTIVTRTASFVTSGTDGKLRYVTIAGDLDEIGQYRLQADLVFPAGYDGPTDIGTFWVDENIQ